MQKLNAFCILMMILGEAIDILDELSLQRNKPYITEQGLYIKQPTLDDIINLGYEQYQDYLYSIISNPKDVADILWCKMKIWYEDITSDWAFFLQKCLSTNRKVNINIDGEIVEGIGVDEEQRQAFNFFLNKDCEYIIMDKKIQQDDESLDVFIIGVDFLDDNHEVCCINENAFKISEAIYYEIVTFLKQANWASFEYEFTKGGTKKAKKYILEHDYKSRMKQKKPKVTLGSIVSSLIAKGQSYNDIWGFPIYMVYDLYYRYIKIDDWNNTMRALHSGCIDTKKNPVNWEKINWSSIITK